MMALGMKARIADLEMNLLKNDCDNYGKLIRAIGFQPQ